MKLISLNGDSLQQACYSTLNQKAVALGTGTIPTAVTPRSKDGQDLFQFLDASRNGSSSGR